MYGNGNVDHAMRSFPPEQEVVQDTFAAVFSGPEKTSGERLTVAQQEELAREALRKEVQFRVDKPLFDRQARRLLETNYVYREHGSYRRDLVDSFPDEPGVPGCLLACAKFVPVSATETDMLQARGPSSSTTGAEQELEAAGAEDAAELVRWMSLVDEQQDDVAELTSLPALQGLLQRMESQAGRVVANEIKAYVQESEGGGGYGALDNLGRARLRKLCDEFHAACAKASREDEVNALHWRVQALATQQPTLATGGDSTAPTACPDASSQTQRPQRLAQLRVPTTRQAETWWNPRYWSIARPTDFCYGDCVWGLEKQPFPLSVSDWQHNAFRREEQEYDMPGDEVKYEAAGVNRFRGSWYDLHLMHSFWRVTETTKSVHTFMKTPCAFGYTRACADITPAMLSEVQLKHEQQQQEGKAKTSVRSLLADKDLPKQVKTALTSLHQATASLVGSDGHRKLLHKEGVAYTLRYGPPLEFVTPNLADTKQPLLLLVQGMEFHFDADTNTAYREMVQRVAADPVGQAIVFELMIRLFFVHVLGVREDTVGWARGAARKPSMHTWTSHGACGDPCTIGIFGPILAAFGPVEAQGRGSLHPHILVWLILADFRNLLDLLLRDEATFKERLRQWMRELIAAVSSVQGTAVSQLPRALQGGDDRAGISLPPLPFGPKEKRAYKADGARETASAVELKLEAGAEDKELFFFVPDREGDDQFQPAFRPQMPLRNKAGEPVGQAAWDAEYEEESKGMWSRPISRWPSGTFPSYRLGERTACPSSESTPCADTPSDEALRTLREAVPSE